MPRPSPPSRLGRFLNARRGATAVEFAMVAFPFMLLLFGIIELAMVFIASTTLEQATEAAARRIRTGEFQNGAATDRNAFRDSVCERMSWLSSGCGGKLAVDVRVFNNFDDLASTPGAFTPATATFTPGVARSIVLVRVSYPWKLFTPLLNNALENDGAGMRRLRTTTAFRNEPF